MGSLEIFIIQPTIFDGIKGAQISYPDFEKIVNAIHEEKETSFTLSEDGILHLEGRLCKPNNKEFMKNILSKVHDIPYSVHPRATKMYQDLMKYFWWNGMKKDVAEYVSK